MAPGERRACAQHASGGRAVIAGAWIRARQLHTHLPGGGDEADPEASRRIRTPRANELGSLTRQSTSYRTWQVARRRISGAGMRPQGATRGSCRELPRRAPWVETRT